MRRKRKDNRFKILAAAGIFIICFGALLLINQDQEQEIQMKKFSSCADMKGYIMLNSMKASSYNIGMPEVFSTAASGDASKSSDSRTASDYSTTNIQVEGVDEADIVKNDGKFIYALSGKKLAILNAHPAESMSLASQISFEGRPSEMFISGDKLVVFGYKQENYQYEDKGDLVRMPYIPMKTFTFINVYDITNKNSPVLSKEIEFEGNYFSSRMIGNHVYVILNSYIGEDIVIPLIRENGQEKSICGCSDINYFDDVVDYSYSLTTIISLNTETEEHSSEVFLTGNTQNIFVSNENIFLTKTEYNYRMIESEALSSERTTIKKISINKEKIQLKAEGSVPGHVLNQFSMDEYDGHFRIATTSGRLTRSGGETSNNVYVLDSKLNTVGKVEGIAPGESIYSARFMGERAYLVTFRKVDPLFTIDLSDPENPKVLGKLKIPGYSDYLHPYDENHLIGIGKEVIGSEEEDFSWYQGVKIALFDVSDVENPVEKYKIEIGSRGTDSYALRDHKAFLFSREKNLLVVPILLAELNEKPKNDWEYGDFTFQGAYVYGIDMEKGFQYKGRITHIEDDSLLKSGYYYYESPSSVRRSLYMDDVLYTISEQTVKANSLSDLSEISSVKLPYEAEYYYNRYY